MAPKRARGEPQGSDQESGGSPAPSSVHRADPQGGDTTFMEEILLELSAQNEHARAESEQRPVAPPPEPSDPSAARPRTVRVERHSEFRTPEGVPSARAYLPARTLSPGRQAPIETETVRVADPRKLPTVRLPREHKPTPPTEGRGRGPRGPSLPEGPSQDDNAPTLRSASPAVTGKRAPERRRWVGWVILAAITSVLVVALAARVRSGRVEPPPAPPPPAEPGVAPEATLPEVGSAPLSTADPAPSTTASTQVPSARPRRGPKSDRWF